MKFLNPTEHEVRLFGLGLVVPPGGVVDVPDVYTRPVENASSKLLEDGRLRDSVLGRLAPQLVLFVEPKPPAPPAKKADRKVGGGSKDGNAY